MDKVKILEIAAEAGTSNAVLLEKAKELGLRVKVANSTLSIEQAEILMQYAIDGTLPEDVKNFPTWESAILKTLQDLQRAVTYEEVFDHIKKNKYYENKSQISERTFNSYIKKLVDMGVIMRVHDKSGNKFSLPIEEKKPHNNEYPREIILKYSILESLGELNKLAKSNEVNRHIKQLTESLNIIQQSIKPLDISKTYLDAIKIKNYFSLIDVEIENLGDKREIYFVGENGDGKTILLQAIVLALKGKKYNPFAEIYIEDIKETMQLSAKVTYPNSDQQYKSVQNIFAYGINRNKISEEKFDKSGYAGIFDTPDFEESIKLKKPNDFLETQSKLRDDFVEELENLMDNKLKIIRNGNKIEFQEINGDPIKFGMLSEGYKTTIIWLSDLVSRLIENQPDIKELNEYEGIVLIDEVDLYLHPKWKYNFMYKLRKIFPKIQFIVTTHSLVTVLGASEDAVFYKLYRDEEGRTQVSQQIDDISHYTANILMTSPLFDLDSMKVRGFDKDERLSSDDYIYREIHQAVREYMQDNPSALDEELKQKARDRPK